MKRGSFLRVSMEKRGGKLPSLRKRYYNQMTVGADSIRLPCVSTMQDTIHIAPRPIWAFGWPTIQKSHPLQGNGWRWCKAPYFLLISLEYLAKYTVRIKKHSTLGT